MEEFVFEDKTEDIAELIGPSTVEKSYVQTNAELGSWYDKKGNPFPDPYGRYGSPK